MSDTHPSIPAVVTLPELHCTVCGRAVLRCSQRCLTCGAPDPLVERGGSEPDADELARELERLS